MPVGVVDVVLMTVMRDGVVPAARAVRVPVPTVLSMEACGLGTFVPVRLVLVMTVTVVKEVAMARVRHAGMAAGGAVLVLMLLVHRVRIHAHDELLSRVCRIASSTIREMWTSISR
jgi:hypothetical protein